MFWKTPFTEPRAWLAISLRDDLAVVRVEPADAPGGRLRVTLAAQFNDAAAGLRSLRSSGALRGAKALVLLPAALRTFHSVVAPDVPPEELGEALRWQLAGNLDHDPTEALLQWLPQPVVSDTQTPQLLAVVAHGPTVRQHIAPLHAAGLTPDVVDIEETAQRNLMLLAAPDDQALACVGFSQRDALITVSAQGELYLTRAFATDVSNPADAAERIALQVQRMLDSFERQSTRLAVRQLLLLPGPLGQAMGSALARQLNVQTRELTLNDSFDILPAAQPLLQAPERFAHLLGSAAGRLALQPAPAAQSVQRMQSTPGDAVPSPKTIAEATTQRARQGAAIDYTTEA